MKKRLGPIAGAALAIALLGSGYALGARNQAAATARDRTGSAALCPTASRSSGAPGGQPATGVVPLSGTIIAVNADSLTIAPAARSSSSGAPTPGSVIVLVGSGTRLVAIAAQDARLADLKAGNQVTAVGSVDAATGTVNAQALIVGRADVVGQLFVSGVGWPAAATVEQPVCPATSPQGAGGIHQIIPNLPGLGPAIHGGGGQEGSAGH